MGLVVAAEHLERLADVVERARDAALVGGAAEQLEAALQVLERGFASMDLLLAQTPPTTGTRAKAAAAA